jgi:hypothetical protein
LPTLIFVHSGSSYASVQLERVARVERTLRQFIFRYSMYFPIYLRCLTNKPAWMITTGRYPSSKKVHPRVRIGSRLPALGWVATGVSYNLCNNFYCHDLWPYIDDSHCTLVPFHYGRHHSSCVNSARMSDITRTHLLPSTDQLILFIDLCAHLQPLIEYVASLRMLYHQLGT